MTDIQKNKVFHQLHQAGGEVFLTGGWLRDQLLGIPGCDVDAVVFGLEESDLCEQLARFGEVLAYGKCFRIYQIKGLAVEFSLPRNPSRVSDQTLKDLVLTDARGRDFTINALYRHAQTGELVDPLNGRGDLNARKLRMASPIAFEQDPLRVYRAVQLISRMDLHLDPDTEESMKATCVSEIPRERIHEELNKWLLSEKPWRGWQIMKKTNHLPEIFVEGQNAEIIPLVLANTSFLRGRSRDPLCLMWSALLAAVAVSRKILLFPAKEIGNHEAALNWYRMMSRNYHRADAISSLLEAVIRFVRYTDRKPDVLRLNRMADPLELQLLMSGLEPLWCDYGLRMLFRRKMKRFHQWTPKNSIEPVISGYDLQKLGYMPGPKMNMWLKTALEMQLEGVAKKDILAFYNKYAELLQKAVTK